MPTIFREYFLGALYLPSKNGPPTRPSKCRWGTNWVEVMKKFMAKCAPKKHQVVVYIDALMLMFWLNFGGKEKRTERLKGVVWKFSVIGSIIWKIIWSSTNRLTPFYFVIWPITTGHRRKTLVAVRFGSGVFIKDPS